MQKINIVKTTYSICMYYTVTEWQIAGLVIIPFLLGLIVGVKWAFDRAIIKFMKHLDIDSLNKLFGDDNES